MGIEIEQSVTEVNDVWDTFELRIAALVSTMIEGGSFSLHVPCEDGTVDEFVIDCDEGCRNVTIGSKDWGSTSLEFDEGGPGDLTGRGYAIGEVLLEILRDEVGLPHPGLMMSSASAGLRDRIGVLGLTSRSEVGVDHVVDPGDVQWVAGYHELYDVVLAHLRDQYDAGTGPDDEGDFPLEIAGVRLWVNVATGQPAIRLLTPIVFRVRSRVQADTELNVSNRDSSWVRWARRRSNVWQELILPGYPFVPRQLDKMLGIFVEAAIEARDNMPDRLGGTVAR